MTTALPLDVTACEPASDNEDVCVEVTAVLPTSVVRRRVHVATARTFASRPQWTLP